MTRRLALLAAACLLAGGCCGFVHRHFQSIEFAPWWATTQKASE